MNCIVRHHKLKFQRAFVIQRELINGYIRNLQAVYKGAVFIDDQSLQKPVLIPEGKPPAGRKPMGISLRKKAMSEGQSLLVPGASEAISTERMSCST